ncbi:hypothetical protein Bhyg_07576 [Pseudolycoriella hygida]|uniref:Uncharacterized protein n=1 Tax=Pseudolycoriella hygida TaxID=35572 RepID=A0A9Q0N2Y0_9DIPT|nr:hypothetical protein Bhyg_07576 [Pseudolycoriella hygida]
MGGIPTKNWSVQNDEERYTRRLEEISRTVQTVVQTMKMGRLEEISRTVQTVVQTMKMGRYETLKFCRDLMCFEIFFVFLKIDEV